MKIFMGMGMENFCGGMDFYVGYGIFFFFFFDMRFFFGHGIWTWRIFFLFWLDMEFFVGHGKKNFGWTWNFFVNVRHGIFGIGFFCWT